MTGWIVPLADRGRLRVETVSVSGLLLLRIQVPGETTEARTIKRLTRIAQRMYRRGIRRVLAPACYPYWPLLQSVGLQPVDTAPLSRALAPRLLLSLIQARGIPPQQAVVLLRGNRVDQSMYECAHSLCPSIRTLALDAPDGGSDLSRQLWWEYGAAVPEMSEKLHVSAVAEFSQVREMYPEALQLWGRKPNLQGIRVDWNGGGMDQMDQLSLIALLWEKKRLKPEDLRLYMGSK